MQRCCHWPAESLLAWPAWCAQTLWSPWETAAAADMETSPYSCGPNRIKTRVLATAVENTMCGTNLLNLLFKTFLQVLVAPDEFVKNLKKNSGCVLTIPLIRLFLGRGVEAVTCAYACMVSMSSWALKRQTSVEVTSSDRVPPGAEGYT